ncbi:MAG: GNAT family N-acetyltransferase [Proteobacteria bacterium]|nr:GNAT family N-acetyltransferase [Pseudomonadota bacterium]
MALPDTPHRVFQRGTWPGSVSLRRGWARAEARPWNDAVEDAALRLVRGGSGFIEACVQRLMHLGAPSVLSSPLAPSARRPWEAAGFQPNLDLALMRLDLEHSITAPQHLVVREDTFDINHMLAIDNAAFAPFWRFDETALVESIRATTKSSVFVIRDGDEGITGYAVVGYGHAISYLQRVAIDPAWQGNGMGRSLVRASARSARRHGSKALLLNTQFDNEPAIGLYESEGYRKLPESLAVLKAG